MIAKKRLLPILIALLMVFAMMPMTAWTVFADNINVPKYVVNLTSGSGSGDPTSFNSQQDGRFFGVSDTGAGVANGQFFSTGQVMYIRLPDCPDTFTGQDGTVFIGWQIDGSGSTLTPGTFVEATNPMNLTAFWAAAGDASLSSLTVDNGVLEPQFSPDVTSYSVKIYYEGSPVEVRATATPAQSDATVTYGEEDEYSCPALGADSSLDIRVTNGANEKIYTLTVSMFYSITTEIEGSGSVKTYDNYQPQLGETNTALNGYTFKLVATPSDGWKFKEWQLISGSGTLNNPTFATATYRVNRDNAVVKAIFVPTYTVTFNAAGGTWTDGTTADKQVTVDKGQAATAPDVPTRDGFTFDGWDPEDFSNITSNLTVTAQWKKNDEPAPEPEPTPEPTPAPAPTPSAEPSAAAPAVTEVTINKATVNAAVIRQAIQAAGGRADTVIIGKKVKRITTKAFAGTDVKTLIVKSKKLKKKTVKGSLKGSSVTTVRVKVGKAKLNKKYVKKYKKIFTKKNAGKKVKVR